MSHSIPDPCQLRELVKRVQYAIVIGPSPITHIDESRMGTEACIKAFDYPWKDTAHVNQLTCIRFGHIEIWLTPNGRYCLCDDSG